MLDPKGSCSYATTSAEVGHSSHTVIHLGKLVHVSAQQPRMNALQTPPQAACECESTGQLVQEHNIKHHHQ